jgi:hypothetical protein
VKLCGTSVGTRAMISCGDLIAPVAINQKGSSTIAARLSSPPPIARD